MKLWFVALICALVSLPVYGVLRVLGFPVTFDSVLEKIAGAVGWGMLGCVSAFFLGIWVWGALGLVHLGLSHALRPFSLDKEYEALVLPITTFLAPGQATGQADPFWRIWILGALLGAVMLLIAGLSALMVRVGWLSEAQYGANSLIDWEALREAAEKKKRRPVFPTSWEYNLNRIAFALAIGLGVWFRYGLAMSWYVALVWASRRFLWFRLLANRSGKCLRSEGQPARRTYIASDRWHEVRTKFTAELKTNTSLRV